MRFVLTWRAHLAAICDEVVGLMCDASLVGEDGILCIVAFCLGA